MAKSQRSSRKKALRTQRANRTAPWVAEAEAKRMAAIQQCLEADPVPVVSSIPPADDANAEQQQQQRGRDGADAMAVEQQPKQPKASKKKKGVKVAAAAGKKGVAKKKGAKAILNAQFTKKTKKIRR